MQNKIKIKQKNCFITIKQKKNNLWKSNRKIVPLIWIKGIHRMHRKNRRPLNAMEISERVRHKMALLHFLSMSVILLICDISVYMLYWCFFSFKLSVKITAIVRGLILIGTKGEQWTWSIYYANAVYVCLLVISI